MSISTVEVIDVADAERRRDEIIRSVGDVAVFIARGEAYELDLEDRILFEELRDLEFLLEDG